MHRVRITIDLKPHKDEISIWKYCLAILTNERVMYRSTGGPEKDIIPRYLGTVGLQVTRL